MVVDAHHPFDGPIEKHDEVYGVAAVALTIAGSDPSGGAGLQADLKTFHQHGIYGASVVSLLTVQNTQSVADVQFLEARFVLAQLDAVLADIPPQAAKTGALGTASVITAVASRARQFSFPLVVDPVMLSKHGHLLLPESAIDVLRDQLVPQAYLVTPNRAEASLLSGIEVVDRGSIQKAAEKISLLGARHVLVKGGVIDGQSLDLLWSQGQGTWLSAPRVDTPHTHGSGCVYSAAITARLALGDSLERAVGRAKAFITRAIAAGTGLGRGIAPVQMHVEP